MVSEEFAKRELAILMKLPNAPSGDDETTRAYRREMGRALQESDSEEIAHEVVLGLLHQEGRQFCPTPGEIAKAVSLANPWEEPSRPERTEYEPPKIEPRSYGCNRCEDTGCVDVAPLGGQTLMRLAWCDCAVAERAKRLHPESVEEFNRRTGALEENEHIRPLLLKRSRKATQEWLERTK